MKAVKLIAFATCAAVALTIAGNVSAGDANPHQSAVMRQRNRRFSRTYQNYPYYPYGYGNGFVQNPDEADWSEQWASVREDSDGPYARSTRENPPGKARMWVIPDK